MVFKRTIKKGPKKYSGDEVLRRSAVWLALLLPMVIMLSIFIVNGIYPFGDESFLFSDMYHQYLPFYAEFIRKVKAGEGIYYSYNVGIGSNFLALYVYYLASPLNLLGFLVPQRFLIEFMSYLVIIRLGLCGLTSYIYLQKHFEKKSGAAVFFSCFYALSGFCAAYNWNVMWLDCIVLLPLIILGLEKLVKEGRCALYIVCLSLSIFTNYYISIMICIFLVLYFLVLLITEKRSFRIMLNFILCSLLAAGMAAVLLVPEVCAIMATDFGDIDFPKKLEFYFSIIDELARHCICVTAHRGLEHWPNIYCGSAVFMLIPLYVFNDRIPVRKKFCDFVLMMIFLISFAANIPDFIWHGLNYPDSLPARQSFIYIFMIMVMCYEAYLRACEIHEKYIVYSFAAGALFLLFCEKFIDSDDFYAGIELLTLLFAAIFAVIIYLDRTKKSVRAKRILAFWALVAVVAETSINTAETSVGTVSRSEYLKDEGDYLALAEYAKENSDSPIYRIEKFVVRTKNDGTLTGYPTASVFSSTMNSSVMELYKKFGMRHSKVFYGYDGATPLTSALLNVSWMFGSEADYTNSLFEKVKESGEISLYRAKYSLPFGYAAPYEFDLPDNANSVSLQNEFIKSLGIEGKLLDNVEKKISGDDVRVTADKAGIYYARISSDYTGKVKVIGSKSGSVQPNEIFYKDLKRGSIIYIGFMDEGESVRITNADDKDTTPKVSAEAYILNEGALLKFIELFSENHLEEVTADTTHINGRLKLENPKRLILSVPYEKGWSVYVNGEKTEPKLFGGCLMALDLEAGDYEIEMAYVPQGRYAGMALSVISIVIFLLLYGKSVYKKIIK